MREESIVSLFVDLPDNVAPAEALAWVKRMRRVIDRWETLPGYAEYHVTPQDKRLAHAELDEMEHRLRREIAPMESA